MNSRERVNAALDFAGPDRLPRDLWGEIDRQRILPFGTPQDVRRDV